MVRIIPSYGYQQAFSKKVCYTRPVIKHNKNQQKGSPPDWLTPLYKRVKKPIKPKLQKPSQKDSSQDILWLGYNYDSSNSKDEEEDSE